jgi:hypothetical protein
MLPVKLLSYFAILQVCAAIEACHAYLGEQDMELALRSEPAFSVYDRDAPWAGYTTF